MNLTAMFFQTLRFYIFERCFVVDIIKAIPQKAKENLIRTPVINRAFALLFRGFVLFSGLLFLNLYGF